MSGIAACDCTAGPSANGLAVFMDGGTFSVGDSKRIGVQLMLSESPKNKKTPAAKDERFSSVVPPLFRSARRAARHSMHGNGCRRPGLLPAHVPAGQPFRPERVSNGRLRGDFDSCILRIPSSAAETAVPLSEGLRLPTLPLPRLSYLFYPTAGGAVNTAANLLLFCDNVMV